MYCALCLSCLICRNASFYFSVSFHNGFVPGKGWGGGCKKRDKLERSHFFSITPARLQGHHLQWVVHGDAPSRKHFNYGLLASVQEGAGSAGQKAEYSGEHKVITIIKSNRNNTRVGLACSQTGNSFCADICVDPSYKSLSGEKKSRV